MAKRPSVIPVAQPCDQLTREVVDGLRKSPKELSPVWFYDELGSDLFDRICELPEYYLTRTELSIMQAHAADMARQIGPQAAVIEFGSGTGLKTRLLLDQLESPVAYVPVDIAREQLFDTASGLARDYPELRVMPVCADFTQPFDLPKQIAAAQQRVVYFPGSTLGNFTQSQAHRLLSRMHQIAWPNGAVLIGIDLKKDPRMLELAYNDSAGVTAQFNLNALRHLNREVGANFDLHGFKHQAVWAENASRIEMRLISQRDQVVSLGGARIAIKDGEYLLTECCHKYTLDGFAKLAAESQLTVAHVWTDTEQKFSVQLLRPNVPTRS